MNGIPHFLVNQYPVATVQSKQEGSIGEPMIKQAEQAATEQGMGGIEPDDFEWIVLNHQKQIFRVFLSLMRDAGEAEALTQECFLRAYRKRHTYRGDSRLSTWLVRIAINLASDHRRNRRWLFWRRLASADGVEALPLPDDRLSPEQTSIRQEMVRKIDSAVERLPERQRTAFLLKFVEEMTQEEIAAAMNLKLGTVKSHLFRATETVKRLCRSDS